MFVATLVKSMPFQGDEDEEGVAIRCLMHLSQKSPDLIKPHVHELVKILENDVAAAKKYKLEGELLSSTVNFLQALKAAL